MSQTGQYLTGAFAAVQTLTGNTGGPVGPTGGNINVVGSGTITVTGNPGTSTLTISQSGVVATSYQTDAGAAVPAAGVLNVLGGNNIITSGAGNTVTIDLNGTTNHAVQIGNALGSLTSLGPLSDGQLVIGSTGADPVAAGLTAGSGISITPGPGTITIATSGSVATTYQTDSGTATPAAGILNDLGGSNINTSGSGNTVTTNLDTSILQPATNALGTEGVYALGATSYTADRFMHMYGGTSNAFLGYLSGNFTLSSTGNTGLGSGTLTNIANATYATAVGTSALASLTDGDFNTAVGYSSLGALTDGVRNTAVGWSALGSAVSNEECTAVGMNALGALSTGNRNTVLGRNALSSMTSGEYNIFITSGQHAGAYTTTESSNLIIGNDGVIAENNTLRIGTSGSGNAQQNRCFIAGIDGVNVGSVATIVTEASDQLGTAVLTAGSGITITPGANLITISATGADLLAYTSVSTTPYVVLSTDEFLGVDSSGGAITIQLPNAPSTGRVFYIKDRTGSANTFNITVTTVGGAVNIDGATTYTMNTQYAAINVLFDGSTYQIF